MAPSSGQRLRPEAPSPGGGTYANRLACVILGALLGALGPPAGARSEARVEGVRIWPAPDHTRLVFDVSAPIEHSVFRLTSPERVVIDLRDARLTAGPIRLQAEDHQVSSIRSAQRGRTDLRVVLDLKRKVSVKSFLLRPNRKYGHRLVVDLQSAAASRKRTPAVSTAAPPARLREVVVAIDAGHGGEDPGASGRHGTPEKDVVLRISRQLVSELDAIRGIHPVLLRTGDYYLRLRKRMALARKFRADLFVSIHADAFRDPRVRGSSVYVLSRNGASSEAAKWLADQENAADLIGGVSLDDKDELLASVLLDLSQTATLSASAEAGSRVLSQLHGLSKLHKRRVQRAGFAVLKSPDIPSILIETGFISNPYEERRLSDPSYQRVLARGIARGILRYFMSNAAPGTLLAAKKHIIARGETLSHIAARYAVPLDALRSENQIHGDALRIGQVLRIPQRGS